MKKLPLPDGSAATFPEKRNDTLAKRTGEETVHFFVVMRQNKLYLGVCQCDAFKFVGDITILYLIVFQKLATILADVPATPARLEKSCVF